MATRRRGPFGEAIRNARTSSGLTQDQAADESGVSRSTLIRWETGEITEPTFPQLKAFLAAVGGGSEDVLRALDLLPPEADRRDDLDQDESALWDLGHRRGWSESDRWALIDLWRARRLRHAAEDEPERSHEEYLAMAARVLEQDEPRKGDRESRDVV